MKRKHRKKRGHHNRYERNGRLNRHHIKAKSKGGIIEPSNIIVLDENRHSAFHLLFGNRTLREAAKVLIRTAEKKEAQDD